MMKKKIVLLLLAAIVLPVSAFAGVLVYEPFAYSSPTLTGQGGAWGTTGTWTSGAVNDATGWQVHLEGTASGAMHSDGVTPVTYDGNVTGLWTMGGYAGHGSDGYKLNADIALAQNVTDSFKSGTTTWISHVSVSSFNKNYEMPNVMLATEPFPTGSRGENNPGSGIGTGGGPNRYNRPNIYPMFYNEGQYTNMMGEIPGNSYTNDAYRVPAESVFSTQFDVANIVVMKIEWDAGANGEDIISLASFLEGEELSEAAFNAINLSSASWAIQPDIDQSTLDTITIAGIKFFVDEIRIGTAFGDVAPCPEPMTLALLGLGGLLIRRRK